MVIQRKGLFSVQSLTMIICGYQINENTKEGQEKGKTKDHNYFLFNLLCLSVSNWWKEATSAVPCCECSCNFCIVQSYYCVCYMFLYTAPVSLGDYGT